MGFTGGGGVVVDEEDEEGEPEHPASARSNGIRQSTLTLALQCESRGPVIISF